MWLQCARCGRHWRAKYLESRFARDATLHGTFEIYSRIHGSDSTPVAHPCPPKSAAPCRARGSENRDQTRVCKPTNFPYQCVVHGRKFKIYRDHYRDHYRAFLTENFKKEKPQFYRAAIRTHRHLVCHNSLSSHGFGHGRFGNNDLLCVFVCFCVCWSACASLVFKRSFAFAHRRTPCPSTRFASL